MQTVVSPTRSDPPGHGVQSFQVTVILELHEIEAVRRYQAHAWDAYEQCLRTPPDPQGDLEDLLAHAELQARIASELQAVTSMLSDLESERGVLKYETSTTVRASETEREAILKHALVFQMVAEGTRRYVESYKTLRRLSLRPAMFRKLPMEY